MAEQPVIPSVRFAQSFEQISHLRLYKGVIGHNAQSSWFGKFFRFGPPSVTEKSPERRMMLLPRPAQLTGRGLPATSIRLRGPVHRARFHDPAL
jgi:hypothetical protein